MSHTQSQTICNPHYESHNMSLTVCYTICHRQLSHNMSLTVCHTICHPNCELHNMSPKLWVTQYVTHTVSYTICHPHCELHNMSPTLQVTQYVTHTVSYISFFQIPVRLSVSSRRVQRPCTCSYFRTRYSGKRWIHSRLYP